MQPVTQPLARGQTTIPEWNLYGERQGFPDVLHIETITERAAGLGWQIAPHRHPHLHQFSLISSGAAVITLDGATPRAVPPFVVNVPQGVVHGFSFEAGTEGWVLTVPVQSLPELLEPSVFHATALGRAGVLAAEAEVVALFARISAEHAAVQPGRAVMLRAQASELACLVMRGLAGASGEGGAGPDPRFVRFQTLVQQNLRKGWTLPDYARTIGLSERHLSRLCRSATGQPASTLIAAAGMREACRMLAYTRQPVAQIGYGLGFDDPSYFSRAFRRAMGVAPAAYRAGFEGEEGG